MAEYCLVSSSDERCWDSSSPLIFMDGECVLYSQIGRITSEYIINETRFGKKEEFKKAQAYVEDFCVRILNDMAESLNSIHGVSYDVKSWRIILFEWLYDYVSCLFYKYAVLIDLSKGYTFYVKKIEFEETIRIYGVGDFVNNVIKNDIYNSYLVYKLAVMLDIPHKGVIRIPKNHTEDQKKMDKSFSTRQYWRRIIELISRNNPFIVYNNTIDVNEKRMLSAIFTERICFKYKKEIDLSFVDFDLNLRSKISFKRIDKENLFERCIERLIVEDIPIAYIEGFNYLKEKSTLYFGRGKTLFFSHNAWSTDEFSKSYLAYARSNDGLKLCGIQHGGTSIFRGDIFYYDTRATDYYYTWGSLRKTEGCIVSKMPSPKLGESYRTSCKMNVSKDDVLFVGTIPFRFLHRFHYPFEINTNAYVINQVNLVEALYREVNNFRCRFYPDDMGWEICERAKDICADLVCDSQNDDYLSSIMKAKICVFDIFMTSWTEAYVLGIPFIVVTPEWMEDYYEDVKSEIESLKGVGVYYNNIDEAVSTIKSIKEDPISWWKEPDRQTVVSKFADTYCQYSTNSREEWLSLIRKKL